MALHAATILPEDTSFSSFHGFLTVRVCSACLQISATAADRVWCVQDRDYRVCVRYISDNELTDTAVATAPSIPLSKGYYLLVDLATKQLLSGCEPLLKEVDYVQASPCSRSPAAAYAFACCSDFDKAPTCNLSSLSFRM